MGSHLVARMRDEGWSHIFVPRRRDFDLTREAAVERLFAEQQPEILIHLAAVVAGIGGNMAHPGLFFYENAVMGLHVIEAARRTGVAKTVVLGTICAYPKFTPIPFSEKELWNGYPEETNAPYGIAKKALLVQCQSYREEYGMNAIFLLPVNLYGPADNFDLNTSHVIPAMIRKFVEAKRSGRLEVVLWGDGSATREFLYVCDAAEAILLATEHYNAPDPVNLGSGVEVSIRDLATTVANVIGYEGRVVWDTGKPNGQPRRCLDTTLAEQQFGFRARTNLLEGIRKTVAWYLAHNPG